MIMKLFLRKYPKILEAMEHRHEMYNRQMDELDRMEDNGDAVIIRPPEKLHIGHTEKNPEELERVYRIGRAEGEKRLADVIRRLYPDQQET